MTLDNMMWLAGEAATYAPFMSKRSDLDLVNTADKIYQLSKIRKGLKKEGLVIMMGQLDVEIDYYKSQSHRWVPPYSADP